MRRQWVLVAAALVGLAGCAAPSAATQPSPSFSSANPSVETASPTPTPTLERADAARRPEQVFDGSCDAALSIDDVSEIVGHPMTLAPSTAFDVYDDEQVLLADVGGISCSWGDALSLVIAPSAAFVDRPLVGDCAKLGYEYDVGAYRCTMDADTAGLRVSGDVSVHGDASDADAVVADVLARVAQGASGALPPLLAPATGAWPTPVDCVGLDGEVDAASAFDDPTVEVQTTTPIDSFPAPAIMDLLGGDSTAGCVWRGAFDQQTQTEAGGSVRLFGGALWTYSLIAADPAAERVEMSGFEHAFRVTHTSVDRDFYSIELFTGANRVELMNVDSDYDAELSLARELVAALDAGE